MATIVLVSLVVILLLAVLVAVVLSPQRMREDLLTANATFQNSIMAAVRDAGIQQVEQLRLFSNQLAELRTANDSKLEDMRRTVDEKLQSTLDKRLGESFRQVSERLEAVYKGLGEMQSLARGVDGLNKVLTNVKTRGTWGEVQLGNLLEQILSAEQYARNVAVVPGSKQHVEFALKLPGQNGETPVWLPMDAKFPLEDYQRLVEAAEVSDAAGVEKAAKALENRVLSQASDIAEKYIHPPHTTDFALMFLPTEGVYSEVLRRVGLVERIQREHRVVVAGPTTIAALLNSLQIGFKTLAIQQRSAEVWEVLGAVKREFGNFSTMLASVKKKLDSASTELENTGTRTRAIERQLREVQTLPAPAAPNVLPVTEADMEARV